MEPTAVNASRDAVEPSRETDPPETVRLLASNPDAEFVDAGSAVWLVTAVPDPGVRAAIESGATFEDVRERLVESGGEFSVVRVSTADGTTVRAHRGVTSGYDVFFLRTPTGEVVVTDCFRDALAHLPAAERTVTRGIVADHLLYRTTPEGTYVAEVDRLGHGETLRWDPPAAPEREVTESLSAPRRLDAEGGVRALDAALDRVTSYASTEGLVTMLSGGVDSTLLHTYLPGGTPSASAAFETPEFEFEVEYAMRASSLLGTDHELVTALEREFPEHLEAAIDAVGMPPHQLQVPTFDLCYRNTGYDVYVNGQTAEGLYGHGAGLAKTVWLTRPLRHLPALHPKQRTHGRMAERLSRSPWDPRGAAQKQSQYPRLAHVEDFAPDALLERRQLRRLSYVRERVPLVDASETFAAHLDWGHWIHRLCDNTLNVYRQLANARGKALRAPFAARAVAEAALAVPSPDRYVDGREGKPIPKALLDRKLPEYETSKPKGNGNLPARRFLRDGPLVEVERRYDLPAFAPVDDWETAVERYPGMGWVLLSWAVWRDRVLSNDDLAVSPHARSVEVAL